MIVKNISKILFIILIILSSFFLIEDSDAQSNQYIEVDHVSYDLNDETLSFRGSTSCEGLTAIVHLNPGFTEPYPCLIKDGTFDEKMLLKGMSPGLYVLKLFYNGVEVNVDFTISDYEFSLIEESISIDALSKTQLHVSIIPEVNNPHVEWSSDHPSVKVDDYGHLTAVSIGKSTITATWNGISDSCTVSVNAATLNLEPSHFTMMKGDSQQLRISNTPPGYNNSQVSWVSNNESCVSVDSTGLVKANSAGSAKITAKLGLGGLFIGTSEITVVEPAVTKESYNFFIQMTMDFDKADLAGYSEEDLSSGINISAKGFDAAEALKKACLEADIPLHMNDDPEDEFYGWIGSMFGLGDVYVGDDVWKYWVQYHDWNYNQWALGYYKDGGNFQLIYKATTMDEADPFPPGVEIEKLYVNEPPIKTAYKVGESFDSTGMVVMADMSVGEDLQVYKYDVSPKTFTAPGEQKVTLTYRGHSTTVDVNVIEVPELVSIEVTKLPDKTHYYVGEKLDPKGMVVTATMSDGTKTAVDAKVPETVFTSVGEQTITVSYLDKTASFKVTVEDYYIPEPDEDDVDKVVNPDGSTTTTTTVDKTDSNGNTVKSEEKVTVQEDGSSKGTKTETITDKDGNVTERNTVTETDKDGNVKSESNTTVTRNDGTTVDTKETVEKDKDGSVKTTESTVTSGDKVTESKTTVKADADGNKTGSETESKTTETLKDADGNKTGTMETEIKETVGKDGKSEREESVVAESDDGNVKTETTSKTDKDGNVTAESKTTVKSESKDVGADVIDAALKQSEQTLSNVTADNKKVDKTVEVEVSNGTSAALSPEAVKKVSDYGAGLKVSVKEGSIDTDSDVLKNLAKDGKTVELSMEANNRDVLKDKQKDIVGDNHFVDLNALVGGENVHQLGGKAIITFGYQLKDGESAVDLKVFYVDDEGNKTLVDATFANGSFTMTVDHFSVYMVENTAAPAPVDPDTPDEDKEEDGISPVLIAGILVVIIAAIVGVVLYTRKN